MAEKNHAQIEFALVTQLNTISVATAHENRDFKPPVSGIYLRAHFLPGQTVQITLGDAGYNRSVGVFQVDIVVPRNAGKKVYADNLNLLTAAFKRGQVVSYDGVDVVIEHVYPSPAQQEPDYYSVPINITWRADTPN